MSTRRAKDDSVMHQNRYASSAEFERGLLANLVAKRVSVLDNKPDRELIWAIQYWSHQPGGLAAVAKDLIAKYPGRIGTAAMVEIGKSASGSYNAAEVREIRAELPRHFRKHFPLRGETSRDLRALDEKAHRLAETAEIARAMRDEVENAFIDADRSDRNQSELAREEAEERRQATKQPASYPVGAFIELCRKEAAAASGGDTRSLEGELGALCLDPAWDLAAGRPWYFAGLVDVLRDYHRQWIEIKSAAVVVTTLGKKVYDVLDYTLHSRSLSLMEGTARTGKSFAAKVWCEQHPGQARFVEAPPSNDESSFFRALARGLGLASALQYKLGELKERVERVLLTGDLLLVLDESQRAWPQRNLRYCFPHRINWVLAMANASVPICMVSTPQFIEWQKAAEEKGGWNSAQLTGRIGHYELLPATLEHEDLMAVGKAVLPEAGMDVLRALAAYARTSARYLAAVDSIAKRAKYLAQRAGRTDCSTDDVRTAMKESVIPSDTRLVQTLEQGRKPRSGRTAGLPIAPPPAPEPAADQLQRPGTIPPRRANVPTGRGSTLDFTGAARLQKFETGV